MNCLKFARIKAGTVTAGFSVKMTEFFSDSTGDSYSGSVSNSSSLNLDLTYKDICRIIKGVEVGKPWAIRGPECDKYHQYRGKIFYSDYIFDLGSFTRVIGEPPSQSFDGPYDIVMFIQYNLFGCPYEDFSGRLNAYGRKAKKAKDDAPPPDPENPEPCPTQATITFLGVPPGTTDPSQTVEQNIVIPYSMSEGMFAYGSTNNEPYTATGDLVLYGYYNAETGEGAYRRFYNLEVKGTRNIQITENYGG